MLKLVDTYGYSRVLNEKTKEFICVNYTGKIKDVYGNRILDEIGEPLQADNRKFEKLLILNLGTKQKVIALVEGKKKITNENINTILEDENNDVYFFNVDGEYLTNIQSYKNSQPLNIGVEECLSVDFKVAVGVDSLTIKQSVCMLKADGTKDFIEKIYDIPYEKEIIKEDYCK